MKAVTSLKFSSSQSNVWWKQILCWRQPCFGYRSVYCVGRRNGYFIAWHVESSWFCCLEFLKEKALKILELCRDDSCGNPEQCVELGVLQIVNVELACQLCIQLWHADSGLCCLFVPAYSSYCCSGNFLIRETQCITHSMHVMLSCGFVLCHTHSGCCYLPFISNLYGYGIQFCAFFYVNSVFLRKHLSV